MLHYEYGADHIHLSLHAASRRAFSHFNTKLPNILAPAQKVPRFAATQWHWALLCSAKVTVQVMHQAECDSFHFYVLSVSISSLYGSYFNIFFKTIF